MNKFIENDCQKNEFLLYEDLQTIIHYFFDQQNWS